MTKYDVLMWERIIVIPEKNIIENPEFPDVVCLLYLFVYLGQLQPMALFWAARGASGEKIRPGDAPIPRPNEKIIIEK